MAIGSMVAFFSLVLHINMFGNYYFYSSNIWFSLDYKIYSYVVNNIHIPLTTEIRIMNIGHFFYLIAGALMCREILKSMKNYEVHYYGKIKALNILCFIVPIFSILYCDPTSSTTFYILCQYQKSFYYLLKCFTCIYKIIVITTIFYSVILLLRYSACIRMNYLKKRILLLASCLFFLNCTFVGFFYLGPFSVSAEKVKRSGFWIFENIQLDSQKIFFLLPTFTLILLSLCMIVLLSFRLDFSAIPFLDKKVQKNLSMINEVLGDSLHSEKNLLFTLQILLNKAEKRMDKSVSEEIKKMQKIVSESLENTARILDNLRAIKYKFFSNDLFKIIEKACQNIYIPDNIRLELLWDFKNCQYGLYDKYHLEKAFINILNNSVEAIIQANKEDGCITINIEYFFRWIVIIITDNGIGISKNIKNKLFIPHYSNKNGKLNWGLGLSYVYKVVKSHYGQIKIDSQKGDYTSVLIMLPLK